MTPKERGAWNTLIFEKQRQIEELERGITEFKFRIKENRKKIWKLQSDLVKIRKISNDDIEKESLNDTEKEIKDIEVLTRGYEQDQGRKRQALESANLF